MTRRFTGRHMLAIMLAFFGVVVGVNLTMAGFATRTFGGTVVDNSYVAGQRFNGWLAEGEAQERLGWGTAISLDRTRHVTLELFHEDLPLAGATVRAEARHPVGRSPDIAVDFRPAGAGAYISTTPLPAGRWIVHLEIRRGGEMKRLIEIVS